MRLPIKKVAFTTLQLAITGGVLIYLLRDPRKREEMALALARADPIWLLAGVAAYGFVEVIAGFRWSLLLKVQGISLSRARIFMLLLIGLFFNFFIPGGTGGDVVKIYYLVKEAPGNAAGAVLSVLVDRVIGLLAMILMAGIFIGTSWRWLTSTAETASCVWTALIILGVSVFGVLFSLALTEFGWVHKLPKKFPFRDKLAEAAVAFGLYGRAWRASLGALTASFGSHLGYFFTFYCAARAFAAPGVIVPTYVQLCLVMPLINAITALPISVGGLGVREGLFLIFLGKLAGVNEGIAVLTSSVGFLLSAVWGGIGGLIYLAYRPTKHARLAEISAEVASLEHHVAEDELALELSRESLEP